MSNINRPRTSDEIQADQWKQAGMPPRGSAAVPAPVDSDAGIDKFLNEHATGRAVFFQFKQGRYANRDGDEIAAGKELVLVYDAVLYGWIRFRGKGVQPDRKMGKMFSGFVPPERESLGDNDPSKWELGLDRQPADPWRMQVVATLVDPVDGSPYIFSTSTSTGRSALAKVIFACKKLRKTAPDDYPVVKLGVGGFQHRDDRIGWVPTPSFEVVRCVKKDGTPLNEVPAAEDLDDEIPF